MEQEKKDSRKLGEPRGSCECQQPFVLHTLLLGIYDPSPVSERGVQDGGIEDGYDTKTRRARNGSAEVTTGKSFFLFESNADKFSRHSTGTPTIISGS